MKPVHFPAATACLSKPDSMTDEECSSLYIHQTEDGNCISLWKATWRQRLRFLFHGEVWLWVWSGQTQPPVCVTVENPFVEKGDAGN